MINKLISLDEGRDEVVRLLPRVLNCNLSDFSFVDAVNNKVTIDVNGRRITMAPPDERTFKSLSGIEVSMLVKLPNDLRERCWDVLVSNSARDVTLNFRNSAVVGLEIGDCIQLNYWQMIDRILDEVARSWRSSREVSRQ